MEASTSTTPPVRLRVLLRERHWQTHRTFIAEYDKAARQVDPSLVGSGPSRAQLHRWTSGEIKGLPYPDHCRVLEHMFPGWTVEQLFERASEEIEDVRGAPPPESMSHRDAPLKGIEYSDPEPWDVSIRGNVVDISLFLDIDIDRDGWSRLTYRHEFLNLSDIPLTRLSRELWFENTRGPLKIEPTEDSRRRLIIQRTHDTANLAKFACQISPPLLNGESISVGYTCQGGQFIQDHYWRQSTRHHVRFFKIRIRHRGAGHLLRCAATEEHPNGSEVSAESGLVWDFEDDDVIMTLTRERLLPNQAVTLRWDIPHEQA